MRMSVGVIALFALGLLVSTSFGDVGPLITSSTGTTSTAPATTTDATTTVPTTTAVPPLFMHSITFPYGTEQAGVQALETNASVVRVEADHSRDTATAPNDPRYPDQWSLPQIGWDQVYGSVDPAGSATVAVLDTGV